MKKTMKRITAFACAALMLCVLLPGTETAYADKRQELQQEYSEITQNIKELDKQLKELQTKKDTALQQKMILDQRNDALQRQIDTVNRQIKNTTAAIEEYEEKEKAQYELFCRQVRQEEERGTVSYWSVLFKANSFSDLLSRMDFVNEVMDYNQRLIADLRQLRQQLAESRAELQEQKQDMKVKQDELAAQIKEANRIINEFVSTEAGLKAMKKAEEEEEERVSQAIKDYEAQHNSSSSNGIKDPDTKSVLNGLIWPSDARYITSPFGNRDQPTAGASTNHKGVDIGASWYSKVYAAQSGKVIQAGWNGGYGYSVTIHHNHGVSTLYAHLDSYNVRVGQQVSRGQVIGKCGSTGISNGPHIHYEVRVNGVQIDPLPYLPGYIAWDW